MEWDLWSSTYDQDASGSNYWSPQHECDFYFGCGPDVIEEDALNMESCIRVLRILITKADTEIDELERDLLLLQKELACVEHEKWPDICCGILNERINQLDMAISTLKNDCADEAEVKLLLDSEPAGTLHEILAQYLDMNILSPVVNVTEHALDKDSSTIDSNKIIKEEGKDLHGTSEISGSLELLLELQKKSDNPEKIEELSEETLVRSPDLGGIILASYHSERMKLSETFDDQVAGNEVRKSQLINTNTGLMDLFCAKSEAKKENEFVKEKDVSPDDFRPAIDISRKKTGPHSILDTSQQQKRGKFNLDKDLCDFAPTAAQRDDSKEPKVAPDEDLKPLNFPLQVVYPKTLCITDTELCSFKDSNGMHTKSALYAGLQLMDEGEGEEHEQDLKSQLTTNLRKSNMLLPSKLKASEKQKLELGALSSREPFDSCTEVIPSTSIIVSTKRQRRSKSCTDVTILNEPMNRKITTRGTVQPDKHETEGRAIVLYDSKFSELQKKRRVTKLPITVDIQNSSVNLDVPNSEGVSLDNKNQLAPHTNKSHSLVDSHDETSSLNSLTLTDLRAMAKEHNVRKYYKLRKVDLVEQLAQRLSSCGT
ncbi:hypothetical protein PHAVU_001G129400 [Phaseolus vulgaris]|uniref:Rho termination factor-like N-terminal domain-containing protein n=1 Tax=Phaseolus vulgaris TaxID=3885 RepID=V7CY13_PHAVU|nr:hypothetical protein PHAVU_001G129400g [Phaseolus vulgaris]XP_007162161.1 hypothetical protein PHAVU_001G129400g [Phaseolus vulgaris]ESW34154.1 hypothetical protein PHAVU_001G129400g [Phaseolus vulgaris]ESW34155.1 hypothetical protein PHAVU_001G129400g [Phaseolus vulgaris]